MATITFRYQPDYEQKHTDPQLIEATVEYSVELPGHASDIDLTVDDIVYHFEMWLRGLGYSL